MTQTRLQSLIEALVNVALGMVISVLLSLVVYPAFGHAFTLGQNIGITVIFTVASIVRSYVVRRWFNAALHRAVVRVTTGGCSMSESAASSDPADPPPDAPTVAAQGTVPKIGDAWPEHGGIYAGISRGEDGAADAHIVLLEATPEDGMTWADAVKWAKSLGDGARLPTRFESALLYANLRDKLDTDNWHWTGTQYSDNDAWFQYFDNGSQYYYFKGAKARARAVRRFVL